MARAAEESQRMQKEKNRVEKMKRKAKANANQKVNIVYVVITRYAQQPQLLRHLAPTILALII